MLGTKSQDFFGFCCFSVFKKIYLMEVLESDMGFGTAELKERFFFLPMFDMGDWELVKVCNILQESKNKTYFV